MENSNFSLRDGAKMFVHIVSLEQEIYSDKKRLDAMYDELEQLHAQLAAAEAALQSAAEEEQIAIVGGTVREVNPRLSWCVLPHL